MGFLDKVKDINDTAKQNRKERKEREQKEKEQKLVKKTKRLIERFDICEGITFKIYLPEKEIVLKQHDGLTKGLVTLAFGLPGYAMTSGVKQKEKRKSIKTTVQVVNAGIIFKNASEEGKDIRIPFDNIISFKRKNRDRIGGFDLILLENQKLELYFKGISYKDMDRYGEELYGLFEHIEKSIDKKATGSQNPEEMKWSSNNSLQNEVSKTKSKNDSLMDELERLANLYEKGLLTDEEFAAMKKKLIEED